MIVVWRITERCNLACGFCAYDRTVTRSRRDANPAAVATFGAILGDYQRATADRVLLSWLGGEPLLWAPLRELEVGLATRHGLRLSVTTNGTTLHDSTTRERLLQNYAEVTVSVDARGSRFDALRGWPGGYARVRDGIGALAAAKRSGSLGPKLRVNAVLMRDTVDDFPALCDELADWGVEEITFNQLGGNDRPKFHARQQLESAPLEAFLARVADLRARLATRGVRLSGSDAYLRRMQASARGERLAVADCGPGEHFLFIDERGRVAPCSFTGDVCSVPVTKLTDVAAMRRLPATFAAMRRAQRPAACENCLSTQVFGKFAASSELLTA
jgi:MoaA/NifB/PqqE/SkfB family radical SAM enzyme